MFEIMRLRKEIAMHAFSARHSSQSDPSSAHAGDITPTKQRAGSSPFARDTATEQSLSQPAPIHQDQRPAYSLSSLPVLPPAEGKGQAPLSEPLQAHASTGLQTPGKSLSSLIHEAHTDGAEGIGAAVRQPLEEQLGYDLSRVRVHRGPASAQVARALHAQAFTLGRDIYLGEQAYRLDTRERTRLLAHESIHTIQQKDAPVAPQTSLQISKPGDAAEIEAERIASSLIPPTVHQPLSAASTRPEQLQRVHQSISRLAVPLVQCATTINAQQSIAHNGTFKIKFDPYKDSYKGVQEVGMEGEVSFTPDDADADANVYPSDDIRLLQTSKLTLLGTTTNYKWTGTERNRNKVRSPGGYFVDTSYGPLQPRQKDTDPRVSPFYADVKGNYGQQDVKAGQHGKNTGGVKAALLKDKPASEYPAHFFYETVAVAKGDNDNPYEYHYGVVQWNFDVVNVNVNNAADGIQNAQATIQGLTPDMPLSNDYTQAVEAFENAYNVPQPAPPPGPAVGSKRGGGTGGKKNKKGMKKKI